MNIEEMLQPEIRINRSYSHLSLSDNNDLSTDKSKQIITKKTILTNEYTKRIQEKLTSSEIIMPPNCRYIDKTSNNTLLLIEENPAVRTIFTRLSPTYIVNDLIKKGKLEEYGYKNFLKENETKEYLKFTLAFPFTIFLLLIDNYNRLTKGYVFLRTAQISGFSDVLFRSPMLNISESQEVCFGNGSNKEYNSLYSATQGIINTWYTNIFNPDFTSNYKLYKELPIIGNYLEWEYYTKINPLFVYNSNNWILYDKNIFQMINQIKSTVRSSSEKKLNYVNMIELFTTPTETGLKLPIRKNSQRTYPLFYDIANMVYLDRNNTLNVGDPILMHNGETAFVSSFVGFSNGGDIRYVQLEKNEKTFLMSYNSNFKNFILNQIRVLRYKQELTLKNGEVIKPGSLIQLLINGTKVFEKVDFIRKSRVFSENDEEIFEIKCGKNFYLSKDLDCKLLIAEALEVNGIKLQEGNKYIFIRSTSDQSPIIPASLVTYKGIDIQNNEISASFKFIDTAVGIDFAIRLDAIKDDNYMPMIIDYNKVRILSQTFRVGRKIYTVSSRIDAKKETVWSYNGVVLYEKYYGYKLDNTKINKLVNDNTFHIEGSDFDTTFSIGDKVVVANWTQPIDILNIKTIKGFTYDKTTADIFFVLESKNGSITKERYVEGIDSVINTGLIRKVETKFDKLTVGTKIISKNSGICNFPKKDVNIVVAIIVDTPHEPLVLCSNGCTLWYSTLMNNFERISMKSKRWEKLKHVPLDTRKIKFQAGDLINGRYSFHRTGGYIIYDPSTTRYLKTIPTNYYSIQQNMSPIIFDKIFASEAIFDCIPTPRLTVLQQQKAGSVAGYLNFHGTVIKDPYNISRLTFLDERRVI